MYRSPPHLPDEFSVAGANKAGVLCRLVVQGAGVSVGSGAVIVQRVVRVQNVVPALAPKAFGGSVQATRNIYLCQSITLSRVRISARGVISELRQITL